MDSGHPTSTTVSRITSYNVCYTKLLRFSCAESRVRDIGFIGTPKGWRMFVGGNSGMKPRIGDELAKELSTQNALELCHRITSYNVCYTKLLRLFQYPIVQMPQPSFAGQPNLSPFQRFHQHAYLSLQLTPPRQHVQLNVL